MHIGAVRTDRYFTQHYRIELDLFSLSPHISLSFVQSSVLNCCNEGNYSSIEYPIPHYMQFATIVIWRAFFFFLPVHNPYSSISRPYSVLLVQHIKLDRISFQIANWIFLVHCHLLPFIHNKNIHHARSISFDSFFYFFLLNSMHCWHGIDLLQTIVITMEGFCAMKNGRVFTRVGRVERRAVSNMLMLCNL